MSQEFQEQSGDGPPQSIADVLADELDRDPDALKETARREMPVPEWDEFELADE